MKLIAFILFSYFKHFSESNHQQVKKLNLQNKGHLWQQQKMPLSLEKIYSLKIDNKFSSALISKLF